MKKTGIINPQLCSAIASLGHTDYLVIADPGLPIPPHVPVIDLTISFNQPRFLEVLEAIQQELVVESYLIASELEQGGLDCQQILNGIQKQMDGMEFRQIPHEEFKKQVSEARYVVRTGETTSFANIILVAGVNF